MTQKNGMLIALMDEYRRAAIDYKQILANISQLEFEVIKDAETKDPDCKSIQTVTTHIVRSGYGYANYINSISNKENSEYYKIIENPKLGIVEIQKMLDFTENSFSDLWHKTDKEIAKYKIETRWGVIYDVEQLLEHAIVHILRHRRQIEKFLKIHTP